MYEIRTLIDAMPYDIIVEHGPLNNFRLQDMGRVKHCSVLQHIERTLTFVEDDDNNNIILFLRRPFLVLSLQHCFILHDLFSRGLARLYVNIILIWARTIYWTNIATMDFN